MKNYRRISALVLISFTLSALSGRENDTIHWSPEFSMQLDQIRDTEISPDGKLVAYVVREALTEGEKSEYLSHIHVASSDGSFGRKYTWGDRSCTSPRFSPDGAYLAFTRTVDDKNQVFAMRVDGGEAARITFAENGIVSFRWSPEGKRIAYLMKDPETEQEKEAKEEKRHVVLVDQQFKYNHLYVTAFDMEEDEDREITRLTSGRFSVSGFDWSPDGTRIVFSHQPEPTINAGFIEADISMIPSDSGAVTALVERPGVDRNPRFSPDGRTVAFVSHGGQPEPVGLADVYAVPFEGGRIRKLPETPNRNASLLGWSADGDRLYVTDALGTSLQVFGIEPDNGQVKAVTLGNLVVGEKEARTLDPVRGTHSAVSLSERTGTIAFVYQEPEQLPQVYVSQTGGFDPLRISTVNSDIELPEMSETRLIRWRSSDGLEIEGLLTLPLGYEKGMRYPLILNVHGGPAGVYTQSFTGSPSIYLLQYFAENGYAILRPNPRGSTGYGKEFRYANVRDWGFGDYDDLLSGVDKVIEMGIADETDLYLMGWSYGGYMTSFMVTRTDRFRAASMGAGLPNLVSMTTTTDIPEYLVGHMGGREFWEDYEVYEKHSAIYRIENVTTPTQVIHGEKDLRVPFTQGQEFYVALKRLGVPTEMIVLPRTPHGPREPKLQMEVSPRILNWFGKH